MSSSSYQQWFRGRGLRQLLSGATLRRKELQHWKEEELEIPGLELHKENGVLHRLDGPAVIRKDGTKEWWVSGEHHREGAPAVVGPNGHEEWWHRGRMHREDGPAITFYNGHQSWYLHGKEYTEAEYQRELSRERFNDALTNEHEVESLQDALLGRR